MIILGMHTCEHCSAALMVDGEIVAAAAEERFRRVKCYCGFPAQAIEFCLEYAGIRPEEIDLVATDGLLYSAFDVCLVQRRASFSIQDYLKEAHEYWYPRIYENKAVKYLDVFEDKIQEETYPRHFTDYFLNDLGGVEQGSMEKLQTLRTRLMREYLPSVDESSVFYGPHHRCHAFYAYYNSGWPQVAEKTLVFTGDSWGDFENATISSFDSNREYEVFHTVNNHHLGRLYRNMTLLLGMKPYQHEYKLMGLAPYAPDPITQTAYDVFDETMDVNGTNFYYKKQPQDNYFWFKEKLEGVRFDGIAGGLQRYFEDRLLRWIRNGIQRYGVHRVAFSGGLAMNVKLNLKITELEEVDYFEVAGSGDDNSTAIGVCFVAMHEHLKKNGGSLSRIKPLNSMYLGPEVKEGEVREAVRKFKLKESCEITENAPSTFIAEKLSKGRVIGRCAGRMEFGDRALGNRSILADPRDRDVIDRINKIIKQRDYWMPFAPTILDENAGDYLVHYDKVAAPHMAIGLSATGRGRKEIPACLHPADHTARPQVLTRKANPEYYEIIKSFRDLTGVGAVLNTSFNLHGFPIVLTPEDAIGVFLNSDLDAILLNGMYIEKREKIRSHGEG